MVCLGFGSESIDGLLYWHLPRELADVLTVFRHYP